VKVIRLSVAEIMKNWNIDLIIQKISLLYKPKGINVQSQKFYQVLLDKTFSLECHIDVIGLLFNEIKNLLVKDIFVNHYIIHRQNICEKILDKTY